MNDKKIIISECCLLQLNHVVRNRLNSLLGFVDIVCHDKELNKVEKDRYINVIKALSSEIYNNLDGYLSIADEPKLPAT